MTNNLKMTYKFNRRNEQGVKFLFFQRSLFIMVLFFAICHSQGAHAQTSPIKPLFSLASQYDDNIYLTPDNEKDDFITNLMAGIEFRPQIKNHSFNAKYFIDTELFNEYADQNSIGQTMAAQGALELNTWRLSAENIFRRYENRSGSEDPMRIPRTSDSNAIQVIHYLNRLNIGFRYDYNYENYRTDNAIGSYAGQALTYNDLDSDEHSGELELDYRLWSKTSLLLSTRVGAVMYDTGRKSDSLYVDLMTGAKGQLFHKGKIEGKVGLRAQNFEHTDDDFNSFVFNVMTTEKFTSRDTLTLSFERSSYPTIYRQNPFYAGTRIQADYIHDLTKQISSKISGVCEFNRYPVETTENGQTAKREDDLWGLGAGLIYKFKKYGTLNFDYFYSKKISNFSSYEYINNKYILGMKLDF